MTDDFNKWWDEDVLVEDNPFTVGTSAYWAWEGWCAAVKAEREACAKTKAGKPRELKAVGRGTLLGEQQFCFDKGWREGAASVRAAIRARGNT